MLKKSPFAAQEIFSTILRLASLQIQSSPCRLRHWICGVSLRQEWLTKKSEFALQGDELGFSASCQKFGPFDFITLLKIHPY